MPDSGSPSERILDATIRHAVQLERLKAGHVRKTLAFLDAEVLPDLMAQYRARLERIAHYGYDRGPATTKRIKRLIAKVREIVRTGMGKLTNGLAKDLRDLAKYEAEFSTDMLQRVVTADLTKPEVATLAWIHQAPFQGRTLTEWFRNLGDATADRIARELRIGLVEGETVPQMVRRVRGTKARGYRDGVIAATRHHAAAIVRTGVTHAAAQAREQVAQDNRDVVEGIRWLSTLDGRTTLVCIDRDGNVYPVGVGPRPPAHVGCRSIPLFVLVGAGELTGTRASMDGQVAATIKYPRWLAGQPAAIQDEALGRARGRWFRRKLRDGLSPDEIIGRFVDPMGRTLTLDELRRVEGLGMAG